MPNSQNYKKTSMLCLKKRKTNFNAVPFHKGTVFFLKLSHKKLAKEYHKIMKEFLLKSYARMCYNKIVK